MLGSEGIEQGISTLSPVWARVVHQDALIVIDPTDIRKLYAKKMEYLAHVRDEGLQGDRQQIQRLPGGRLRRAAAAGSRRCTCGCGRADGGLHQPGQRRCSASSTRSKTRAKKRPASPSSTAGATETGCSTAWTGANFKTSCASWATATCSTASGPRWPNWRHPRRAHRDRHEETRDGVKTGSCKTPS